MIDVCYLISGPSQLLTEEATPQEPVYATIKPPLSQNWPPSSPLRSSQNSLSSALNSTPLVKAAGPVDPPKFHPTNPFYTTLPTNYSSASKLPVPNGKSSISSLDRSKSLNKSKDTSPYDYYQDLKSSSYFSANDYGSSSQLNSTNNFGGKSNGYEFDATNSTANGKSEISYDKGNQDKQSLPNDNFNEIKNPFRCNRINSDPFEKYLNPDHKLNGKIEDEANNISYSVSDNSFQKTKEITERSTITEHKISEIEEVKTIKKIFLNGSNEATDQPAKTESYINMNGERKSFGLSQPQPSNEHYQSSTKTTSSEHFATSPTKSRNDNTSANNQNFTPSAKYHFVHVNNDASSLGEFRFLSIRNIF